MNDMAYLSIVMLNARERKGKTEKERAVCVYIFV